MKINAKRITAVLMAAAMMLNIIIVRNRIGCN